MIAKEAKEANAEIVGDEYDLQPGEMTKQMFADKAKVTTRQIEIWVSSGKIGCDRPRRRVEGKIHKTPIFKTYEVAEFLKSQNEGNKTHKIDRMETDLQKTKESEINLANASQSFVFEQLGKFADSMNSFTETIKPSLLPPAPEKPFLNVKEASEFTQMSESCIRQLVKDGVLGKFTGRSGETIVSRKQILNL